MCKREGIFFGVLFLWILLAIVEISFFPIIGKNSEFINIIPILILFLAILPRYFSRRYNNWLESKI
jgi:hypothetical protein